MKTVANIKTAFVQRRQINKRLKALQHLSDRTLEDIGLDPHMVRMGKSAYPWRSQG